MFFLKKKEAGRMQKISKKCDLFLQQQAAKTQASPVHHHSFALSGKVNIIKKESLTWHCNHLVMWLSLARLLPATLSSPLYSDNISIKLQLWAIWGERRLRRVVVAVFCQANYLCNASLVTDGVDWRTGGGATARRPIIHCPFSRTLNSIGA